MMYLLITIYLIARKNNSQDIEIMRKRNKYSQKLIDNSKGKAITFCAHFRRKAFFPVECDYKVNTCYQDVDSNSWCHRNGGLFLK